MGFEAIEHLSFQRKDPWYRRLDYGEVDVFMALLINKCRNLGCLSLDFDQRERGSLIRMVLLANSIESHDKPGLLKRHCRSLNWLLDEV